MTTLTVAPQESRLIVARRATTTAALQFYGMVGEAFGGFGAARFAAVLDEVKDAKSVTLYMSSEGGDFFEGIAIYSQLARFAESHDFSAVVDGIAASAASVIAMAAPRLMMAPPSRIMIHEARTGAGQSRAADLRGLADRVDAANTTMVEIYAKRTGMPPAQIRAFFANGDTEFNAEQAVALGFADAIEGEQKPARPTAAVGERQITAARIAAQLARERREAASRSPGPGQPGSSTAPAK